MGYWLVKQEPEDYSWATFVSEGKTAWTGVRSFPARKHLRAMKRDDLVLYYHSGTEKQIVGLARVAKEAYADPTAAEGDWSSVDLVPTMALGKPVPLQLLRSDRTLKELPLLTQTRLSVMPVTRAQFERLLKLSETKIS